MIEWQDTVSTWVLSYAPRAAMGTARAITVSDLVACLKENPGVRDTVLTECFPNGSVARAERAERALAALRDQVAVAGCECSTFGERTYSCRHDNLCGLCRLRHRAENAERERDELHALIHDQSGLDDHKYTPGQMVAEMAARWQGASDDCDRFERERDEARAERDDARATNRDNLAMWEVERDALKAKLAEAERENLTLRNRIGIDRTSWHEAEAEVKVLRAQLAKTARERDDAMTLAEERRDYARAQNAKLSVECDDLRAQLTAVERERDEAHAALRDCATRLGNGSAVSPKASHAFHCAVATEVGIVVPALRARLAKTERVVGAARKAEKAAECRAKGCTCCANVVQSDVTAALRALDAPDDSPVGAGTDSGGSGAATPGGHTSAVTDASPGQVVGAAPRGPDSEPEPAGIIPCVIGPPLRFDSRGAFDDDDSPVEVAATACDHKRQRCENDHAVCRDCGAVNRAVTGVVDWGPPRNRPR